MRETKDKKEIQKFWKRFQELKILGVSGKPAYRQVSIELSYYPPMPFSDPDNSFPKPPILIRKQAPETKEERIFRILKESKQKTLS